MSTFAITYAVFWLAVALYVIQLGSRQRKLLERIESLQLRFQDPDHQQVESLD